jgi:hypothetical protein
MEHHGEGQRRFRWQANVAALDRETGHPAVVEAKGLQYPIDHVAQAHRIPVLAPQRSIRVADCGSRLHSLSSEIGRTLFPITGTEQ